MTFEKAKLLYALYQQNIIPEKQAVPWSLHFEN